MAPADNGIHSILSANDADHARYRRLLSHAFSEQALRQQEYLLQSYIELLVGKLRKCASSPNTAVVDLVQWLNFTTFDMIGDLALGESFRCLDQGSYHSWVAILFTQFKTAAMLVSLRLLGLGKPLRLIIPKSMLEKRKQHAGMANAKIHKRLEKGASADVQRNDFMTYVLRHNDEKGMSIPEIEVTMRILVLAGGETTATAMSGIMGNLLRNSDAMKNLVDEMRNAFKHVSEIDAERVSRLPYLGAVIEEGVRLGPPVALRMPRVVPAQGATVAGHWLPGGTFVSASSFARNRSSLNFLDSPSTFDPSRWLPQSSGSSSTPPPTPAAFNPFSLGPRNCLGRNLAYLEMRLILAHLLWAFDFEAEGEVRKWEEQKTWILWDKKPLMVRVKNRNIVVWRRGRVSLRAYPMHWHEVALIWLGTTPKFLHI